MEDLLLTSACVGEAIMYKFHVMREFSKNFKNTSIAVSEEQLLLKIMCTYKQIFQIQVPGFQNMNFRVQYYLTTTKIQTPQLCTTSSNGMAFSFHYIK